MEKGSSATLGSFVGLAPEGEVLVQGVNCLGRCVFLPTRWELEA